MKPKTMILMILAIVCGLVASYMTSQLIAQNKEELIILRTKGKLTQWTTIRNPEENFEEMAILKKNAPNNLTFAWVPGAQPPDWKKDLKGRRLRSTIDEGAVLTDDHLQKKEVTGIDAMLEKGKRAISIPISADKAVAFFVVPGSKVDVIHTLGGQPQVLLENVLVLAIDLSTQRADDRPGAPGATATLQMDNTEQVLKLAGARDRGSLSLVIRPPSDDNDAKKEEPVAAVLPPIPPPPPPIFEEPVTPTASEKTPVEKPKRIKAVDIVNGPVFVRHEMELDSKGKVIKIETKTYDQLRAEAAKPRENPKPVEKPPEKTDDK